SFAVDPLGRPLIARSAYHAPFRPQVEVQRWDGGRWSPLGEPFVCGLAGQAAQSDGKPAPATDEQGRVLFMFDDAGWDLAYRWDEAAPGWTRLGSADHVLNSGYVGGQSWIQSAGAGRAFAMTTWASRFNGNLGCYGDGLDTALFDGAAWTSLGDLKLDQRISDISGCPLSYLSDASLAVDRSGK